MKLRILALACLTLLILGTSAHAALLSAQQVLDYNQGSGITDALRTDTFRALGDPDDHGSSDGVNFMSLGIGGSAVFTFGADFTGLVTIYETTYGDRSYHPEYAFVEVSTDNTNWVTVGTINNQSSTPFGGFSLNVNGIFSYLRITDTTNDYAGSAKWGDGFDIDGVHVTPTPIPGAALLLGTGLFGLVGIRRRFSN